MTSESVGLSGRGSGAVYAYSSSPLTGNASPGVNQVDIGIPLSCAASHTSETFLSKSVAVEPS